MKRRHDLASVTPLHAGVMVAVQRFRSDLGLYVHLHCLATDGHRRAPLHGRPGSAEEGDEGQEHLPVSRLG